MVMMVVDMLVVIEVVTMLSITSREQWARTMVLYTNGSRTVVSRTVCSCTRT